MLQKVRLVRHSLKDAEKNISKEGMRLAKERVPMILSGMGSNFPTYAGPLPRCTQTANEMGIQTQDVTKQDAFHIPDSAMDVISAKMDQIKALAKAKGCTGMAALLKMKSDSAIAKMLTNLRERVRAGALKVCKDNPGKPFILVVSHSPTIDAVVDGSETGGLNELDWVDVFVNDGKIIQTVVCRHVAVK